MTESKVEQIKTHVEDILNILEIPVDENTENTPHRVAKYFVNEMCYSQNNQHIEELESSLTVFNSESGTPVEMGNIPFSSVCSHHLMPYFGKVTVYYVPVHKIIGLSKIPRIIQYLAKKPSVQENLTKEILDYIVKVTECSFARVNIEAVHTCMLCRGVRSDGLTKTESVYGGLYNV